MLMWPKASTTPSLPRIRFATTRSRIAAGTRSFMTLPSRCGSESSIGARPRSRGSRPRRGAGFGYGSCRLLQAGELQQHPVGLEWDGIETNSRGVAQRIAESGGDRIVRALAHRLGSVRADRVAGLGEIDLLARDVGKRRDVIVAKRRIDHAPRGIAQELFVERGAERLRDTAFDLPPALHGIDDAAGVGGVDALQNPDFAGMPIDRDTEALEGEGDRPGRAAKGAIGGQLSSGRARRRAQFDEAHPAVRTTHR